MDEKAYRFAEEETERLRTFLLQKKPDAEDECSILRMNTGRLKGPTRRKAIAFIRSMQALDGALGRARALQQELQRAIDLDLRRDGVVRQEEALRKEKVRNERLDALNKRVNAIRAKRKSGG